MISVISTVAIASEHALKCCSHVRNMQFLSEARKLSKVGRLKGILFLIDSLAVSRPNRPN